MQREFEAFLWDIHECGGDILEVTNGKTEGDYLWDRHLRRIVGRNFEIIGEALKECTRLYPGRLNVSDPGQIIAFRNHLAHGYFAIDDAQVWRIVEFSLPTLLSEVRGKLEEWRRAND